MKKIMILLIFVLLASCVPTPAPTSTPVPPTFTPSPIPSTKTPTPAPTKTKAPTATPRPSIFSVYDDFSSGSSSKKFDKTLWGNPSNRAAISWKDGYLIFSGTDCDCVLPSNLPAQWQIGQIGKLQADLKIEKVSGGYGFIKIQILTTLSDGKGTWWTQCRTGSYDGEKAQVICDTYRYGDTFIVNYESEVYPIEFGKSYTVAIELAPDASVIRYFVDNKEIGSYKPLEKDLLSNANFTWQIGLYASKAVSATGTIDNVMVGTSK